MGDRLRRADGGMAKVLAIDQIRLEEPQPVYNFTVKGPHTYFVLDVGVLVHNASCLDEVREIFNQFEHKGICSIDLRVIEQHGELRR